MPKRPHSPALESVLSVKHAHTNHINYPNQALIRNFDSILSDETVLTIFGFLDSHHLCLVQTVNKYWSRLATDNHLWRIMFLREFSQQRLRGSRGFLQRTSREIKPLPSRFRQEGDEDEASMREDLPENYTDWRWMYRISSNWSRGRCSVVTQRVNQTAVSGPLLHASSAVNSSQPVCRQDATLGHRLAEHLLLVGDLTIYASQKPSAAPTVYIFRDSITSSLTISYQPQANLRVSVTSLSLDHSSANLRLAIFYSDGTWGIHRVEHDGNTSTLLYKQPVTINLLSQTVIQAAYHHPLLVTLTAAFRMSIFYLPPAPAPPVLKYTLSSYSNFFPSVMTLSRYRTLGQYRVLLAHASPVYPAHWAPSVTDMTLSTNSTSMLSQTESSDLTTVRIVSSSSTSNSIPLGWIPDGTPEGVPEELRLRWARKVSHVSGIQTDGKFVVFASEDGGIQVHRLHRNAKLLYEQTLFPPAHAPSPQALSVADSRCVCATRDGGLWVWDLETGTGVQAEGIHSDDATDGASDNGDQETGKSISIVRIAFDAHRIVAVDASGAIQTYSFDI